MYALLGTNAAILIRKYKRLYTEYQQIVFSSKQMNAAAAEPGLNAAETALITNNDFSFTAREIELIEQCMLGKKNKEIAKDLFITERTVKAHFTNIFKKTDTSNKLELLHVLKCHNNLLI